MLSPEAHLLVGCIHLRAGHAREAIDALEHLGLESGLPSEAQAWLAQAHVLAKDVPAARAAANARCCWTSPTSRPAAFSPHYRPADQAGARAKMRVLYCNK